MLDQLIRPAFARLRPGGWLESQELGLLECDDGTVSDTNAFKRWCDDLMEASAAAGRPLEFAKHMKRWYEEAGFVDVQEKVYKIPINGWPRVPKLKKLGEMWQDNLRNGLPAFSYALWHRVKGMAKEEIEVSAPFCWPCSSRGLQLTDDNLKGLARGCQEGPGRPAGAWI